MENTKKRFSIGMATTMLIGILILAVACFIYAGRTVGNQSVTAMYPAVDFFGEVKIADGEWSPYHKGESIPADKGEVMLRGHFELVSPVDGESFGPAEAGAPISFYLNHIMCEVSEGEGITHTFDTEMQMAGEDMCGKMCIGYEYRGGEEVLITFRNPHSFGNKNAINEFLDNLSVYGGTAFENDMQNKGNTQRSIGIALILVAFLILGTAIFSLIIKVKGGKGLLLGGVATFFGGVYFIFSAEGVMYWSEIIKFNTRVLGISMMLYMLFTTALVSSFHSGKNKKISDIVVVLCTLADIVIVILPALAGIKFYDALGLWAIFQAVMCLVMLVLSVRAFLTSEKSEEVLFGFSMVPMIAFVIDIVGVYFGLWQGGAVSSMALVVIIFVALVMLVRVIPTNLNATMKARELEAEKQMLKAQLAESKIAILISQIQPHFIYNTLGTIEQLCLTEPDEASKLVHNFSLYLRGNFSELDNARPIQFSKEMEHVKHYTDIEQVRFPDMTIQYDLRSVEFVLPALSVQPLVENSIKHGLMGLEKGGIVTISAYETDTDYIVEVKDDGVGFDMEVGYDEKKHVGIKNIRGRIEAMCGGTLTVESRVGMGTCATIRIPKEATKE